MYGAAKRYVTRERVEAMLDYEVRCSYMIRAQHLVPAQRTAGIA